MCLMPEPKILYDAMQTSAGLAGLLFHIWFNHDQILRILSAEDGIE